MNKNINLENDRNGINRKLSNLDLALIKQETIKNSSGADVDLTKQTILDIAIEYLSMGFSIIPIQFRGKKPVLITTWKKYQSTRPSQDELAFWFGRNKIINIGLVLGKVSGGLIAIDFDIIESFKEWKKKYTQIAKSTAISKTGKGYHVIFKFNGNLPPNFKPTFNGNEFGDIKSEGGYIVVPPSIHEKGQQYTWLRHPKDGIYEIKDLSEIGIEKKNTYKKPTLEHKLREPESTPYGIAALDAECKKITSTQKGNRNNQIFKSATTIFELVAGGELSLTTAYQSLKEAGLSSGLVEKEVEATLKSAKEHGFKNPRTASHSKKQNQKQNAREKTSQPPNHQKELLLKSLGPYSFIEPDGFSITKDAIYSLKPEKEQITLIPIAHNPILIVAEALSLDTHLVDVKLAWEKENSWRELWTERRTITDAKKIHELSNYGLPVYTGNASNLVSYLSKFEVANRDLTKRIIKVERCGWKNIQGKNVMVIGQNVLDPQSQQSLSNIEVTPPPGFENYINAFNKGGSFDKWRQAIDLITDFPLVMFQLYASFAAPFLPLISSTTPNFVINISNTHSTGKTSSQYPAASVWGFPVREQGGLITSWNATKVGIENIAYFCNNLPVFLDDLQNVDDDTVARVIYMFANGIGRIRGALKGIRNTFHWQGILFSNGEKSIADICTYGGACARVIDVWEQPFKHNNGKLVDRLKTTLSENYGHAGPAFILWMHDKIKDTQTLKDSYNICQYELAVDTKNEVEYRMSHYFASIWTIAKFVDIYLKLPSGLSNSIVTGIFDRVTKEQVQQSDKPQRALNDVLSWVEANLASFIGSYQFNKSNTRETFGIYRQDEYIAIYPHKLDEFLEKHRYNASATLRTWKDRGWIKTDDGNFTYPVRYENKRQRMIFIPFSTIKKMDINGGVSEMLI